MKLAGNQRLQLNVGTADADQIDLNSLPRVKTFLLRDKKRQVVEILGHVTRLESLRAYPAGSERRT